MLSSSRAAGRCRAVFLDRDGVLVPTAIRGRKPIAITAGDAVEILDGVREACQMLKQAGYLLIVVTNQPDIARERTPRAFVEEVNACLSRELDIDAVCVCYHDDSDKCECRKPKPGMFLDSARQFGIDLAASVMVGDRWLDIEAGRRAGCKTVFVDRDYDEQVAECDHVVTSLAEAVPWIFALSRRQGASTSPDGGRATTSG